MSSAISKSSQVWLSFISTTEPKASLFLYNCTLIDLPSIEVPSIPNHSFSTVKSINFLELRITKSVVSLSSIVNSCSIGVSGSNSIQSGAPFSVITYVVTGSPLILSSPLLSVFSVSVFPWLTPEITIFFPSLRLISNSTPSIPTDDPSSCFKTFNVPRFVPDALPPCLLISTVLSLSPGSITQELSGALKSTSDLFVNVLIDSSSMTSSDTIAVKRTDILVSFNVATYLSCTFDKWSTTISKSFPLESSLTWTPNSLACSILYHCP